MFRKILLNSLHEFKLCNKISNIDYPWGWKSKDYIKKYKYKLINNNFRKELKYKYFNENEFLLNSSDAYKLVYNSYKNNIDFLDYEYTNPKLSIALNSLRNKNCNKLFNKLPNKINIDKSTILSIYVKKEITTNNFKFLGYYNDQEIIHELSAGIIGPEIQHIWDQKPNKQIINVLYKSDLFYDIVEWECDLSQNDPNWQISNINKIIYQ